eukprot:7141058-Pyramimonas_sp.AAC.1
METLSVQKEELEAAIAEEKEAAHEARRVAKARLGVGPQLPDLGAVAKQLDEFQKTLASLQQQEGR